MKWDLEGITMSQNCHLCQLHVSITFFAWERHHIRAIPFWLWENIFSRSFIVGFNDTLGPRAPNHGLYEYMCG